MFPPVRTLVLLALLLAGCVGPGRDDDNRLSIRSADVVESTTGPVLDISLDCHLGPKLRDALDHGTTLTLALRLRSNDGHVDILRRVEMRYFPLSRRYVLRDRERSDVLRSAVAPAYLVDALAALRLPLDRELDSVKPGRQWRVDVELDHQALPGALRLPALLSRDWRLRAEDHRWTASAG